MSQRRLFVTTALPYANGNFHIGHIMEYIQADIWVRFQRMQGHAVNFVGADDAHGAPIMIAAEKAGKTPQQFVADIAAGRKPYLDGFHISFDNWHSTDGPENHELAQQIYLDLKKAGLIATKTIEQFFDPEKNMFLPDRYIKGECPKCGTKDQYGDNCENCGAVYAPTDLINPVLGAVGRHAGAQKFGALLLQAVRPALRGISGEVDAGRQAAARGGQQGQGMVLACATNPTAPKSEGLGDWDISRDAPYFGIEIPDAPGKYFYVWLDAPVGYLASLKNLLEKRGENYDAYMATPGLEQYHFIGKDIVTFHTLFWPAMLHFSGRKTPDNVFVHGFLTVNNGEKMSKSRGTGLDPLKYLSLGMNPEWLRYYLAAKLNARNEDIDFNPTISWRASTAIWWASTSTSPAAPRASSQAFCRQAGRGVGRRRRAAGRAARREGNVIEPLYESREFAKALRETMLLTDRVNAYVDQNKPWELAKQDGMDARLQDVCTVCIEAFRLLTIYLKPVLPRWRRRSKPS
jgi:methionyl-tRNA synthetase